MTNWINRSYLQLAIAFLLLLLSACKKQKGYPENSNSGSNVFGCYVDGGLFIPCASYQRSINSSLAVLDTAHLTFGNVSARNKCDKQFMYGRYFTLFIDSVNLLENKTYKLGNFYSFHPGVISITYNEDLNSFTSDSSIAGTITIRKFDHQRRILSAYFETLVWSLDSTKTKTLTKGTFDISF